jgi:hypothetical protein
VSDASYIEPADETRVKKFQLDPENPTPQQIRGIQFIAKLNFSSKIERKQDETLEIPFVKSKRPEIIIKKNKLLSKLIKIPKLDISKPETSKRSSSSSERSVAKAE